MFRVLPLLLSLALAGTSSAAPPPAGGFTVRITSPDPLYLVGPSRITAQAFDGEGGHFGAIAWMSLSVDGDEAVHVTAPPWAWDVDLGPRLARHRVEVTAVAHDGRKATVSTLSSAWPWVESVGVDLVLVPAVVRETAPDGTVRVVTGLGQEDFTVLDEGKPVAIRSFSSEPLPASIVVALDTSLSMERHLWSARRAVQEFIEAQPSWMAMSLVTFNDQVFLDLDFTLDRRAIAQAVAAARPGGQRTALNEALRIGARHLGARAGPRVLVFFTDGVETAQEEAGRLRTAIEAAQGAEVTVYGIAYGNEAPDGFAEMVARTGGEIHRARGAADLREAFARVTEALGSRYVIGFEPAAGGAGRGYRRIEVRVSREGARVLARDGYDPGAEGASR